MPRPRNSFLHDLFDKNTSSEIVCNKGSCKSKILYPHTGNLERHLKQFHPDLYTDYVEKKCANKIKLKSVKSKIIPNELNRANIELAIVELFTKNGRPLHMVDDRAFKVLVQPVFDALCISVNEHNVIERIIAFSQKIKQEIIVDLKGKLLSLKVDAATRQDLCVLGINVQYIKNKSIQIKTLAVKELKSSHTGDYLKSVILDVLKEYAIDINQILTITTDNGANMLKTVKLLNTDLQNTLDEESLNILEEEDVDHSLLEEQMESIRSNFSSCSITGVRCGAHTLQLCVYDVIKTPEIKSLLENCRSVIKKLRSQTYLNILKTSNYKKPIIDCITRWNSTFDMLTRLLEIKDIIDPLSNENPSLHLSPDKWKFVQEFTEVFKPIYKATLRLQSEQLCFSDLYIIIMDILFQVEHLPSSTMTKLLLRSINKRKCILFDVEIFNAAIFLDPRIKICINSEQKERAKKYITGLHKRINSIKETIPEVANSSVADESLDGPSTSGRAKSLSEFLQNLDQGTPESNFSLLSDLEAGFMMYERESRLPLNSSILEYWYSKNNALSALAEIILAVPSTQVSVERLFSALKYILSDQRNRLTAFNVEHILMVKVNGVFNYGK